MKRADSNKISSAQLLEWDERNREPGVLPAVPVLLLSLLTGDKAGVTMNFSKNLSLDQAQKILQSALAQVEAKLLEVKAEGNGTSAVDGTG